MGEIILRFPGNKLRAITLSYDDGRDFDRQLVNTMNQYGLKGTFNLDSGRLGCKGYVTAEEVPSLYEGQEVAVHTVNHPHLWNLDSANIAREVLMDRLALEKITGKFVRGMAYPFGFNGLDRITGARELSAVESCGIVYSRITTPTCKFDIPKDFLLWEPTCHFIHERLNELIDLFFEKEDLEHPWRIAPRLFYIWGHSYEYEGKWEMLTDMAERISGKENVWYATNMEIYRYVTAFKLLEYTADGHTVFNPTSETLYGWDKDTGKDFVIQPGETIQLA